MRTIRRHLTGAIWMMVALVLSGCSTHRQLPLHSKDNPEDPAFIIEDLEPGDEIEIRTTTNATIAGRVRSWNDREIEVLGGGQVQTVQLRYVLSLAKVTPSPGKTVALVLGVLGTAILGLFIAIVTSLPST